MTIKRIITLASIIFLCLLTLSPNLEAKGRNIDITITPDKAEDYVIEEKATFDIEMTRRNKPANIKLKQIEATFPNEEVPVSLTKVSKGKFKYISEEFEETGEKTLAMTVRTYGAVKSVESLERAMERLEKRIEKLEERKENTNNERLKRILDRLIAKCRKSIQKIEAKIEKIRKKGIIGETSLTINVIPIAPPPEVPESGHIYGNVYDSVTELPIYEVVITVEGIEGGVSTNNEGRFRFPISEFEGDFRDAKLLIQKEGYISVTRNISVVSERDVSVGDIYLKEVDPVVTEITPAGGEATDSAETVKIIFPAGAVSEPVDIVITPYEEAKEIPQELPLATNALIGINVEAEGVVLTQPVTVELPNDKGFAPGTLIPIGSYDEEIEEWVHETMAVVSADGTKIVYQTTHFSDKVAGLPTMVVVMGATPSSHGDKDDDDDEEEEEEEDPCEGEGSRIGLRKGNLILEHALPEVKYLGKTEALNFRYNTETVNPRPRISMKLRGPSGGAGGRPIPETYGFDLSIGYEKRHVVFESQLGWYKQSYMFDARDGDGNLLSTGSYPYSASTSNDYDAVYCLTDEFGGPPLASTGIPTEKPVPLPMLVPGRIEIQNETNSPFGAGWNMEGLQRMYFDPDGIITIATVKAGMDIFAAGEEVAKGFGTPGYMAISSAGDIIVTDPLIAQMDDVEPSHEVITVARIKPDGTKEAILTEAEAQRPSGVVYDPFGNLYIANAMFPKYDASGNPIPGTFPTILRIDPLGTITPMPCPAARPGALKIDTLNNLYVADLIMGRIYKITPLGQVSIFAKGFQMPGEMAFDTSGNLYVANGLKSGISRITPSGEKTVLLRDIKKAGGLTIAPDGKILVTGIEKGVIYRVDPVAETHEIIAKGFMYPSGIAVKGDEIIVANASHGVVTKISIDGEIKGYTGPSTDYSILTKNIAEETYTRKDKYGVKTVFNKEGLQIEKIDRNNNITSYTYIDANGDSKVEELSAITLPTGQNYTFAYDASGKLNSITDPANRVTQFAIDGESNLTQITNPDGTTRQFTYSSENHLVLTKTNERGNTNEYTYDDKGKIAQVILPERDVAEVDPDTGEVTITRKRPTHTYGPSIVKGNTNDLPEGVGTEENPAPTVALADITDDYTDQAGNQTIYKTDRYGRVIERTDTLGNLTKSDRDREGNARKTIRANGGVAEMKYDEKDNLIWLKDAEDGITEYEYDSQFNQITAITDARGNTTITDYDTNGNPIKITDALGNETVMTYNSRGLLTSTTDALDNTTTFTYDAAGNLITITDPLGNTTIMTYDSAGNLVSSEDAEERITQYKYDEMNRLTKVIDADTNETSYAYDSAGNLISVTDANGNTTTFEYNEKNILARIVNPLGKSKTFIYDINKNLASTTDANGNAITCTYDEVNQLIKKWMPSDTISYAYDTIRNLISVSDNDSNLSFVYDLMRRLTSSSTASSPIQPDVTISYTYDKNGNRLTMTDTTGTTDYSYDALNRLLSLINPNAQSTTFNYDELNRKTSMSLPNGISTSCDYDSASQLTSIQSLAVSYQYNYDKVGNRTSTIENTGTNNYVYDLLNRLASVTHPQPTNPAETFEYDTVGNRLTSHISSSYTYDETNRLLGDDQYTYTYDNNGNMISKIDKATLETTTYTYNPKNQLARIDFADGTYATYAYDGLGRRINKNVNGTIMRYVYNGEDILLEYNDTNTIIARYTHGLGIDEPLIMERGGQSYFYHVDGLGSIVALTDNFANIVQTYTYDSFGNIVEQTGSLINPYAYTSREYDAESGLYFYRARYYDATIGRFITADPIGFRSGVNFYSYVGNNPVNWVDPMGLDYTSDLYECQGRCIKMCDGAPCPDKCMTQCNNNCWTDEHYEPKQKDYWAPPATKPAVPGLLDVILQWFWGK